MAVYIATIPSVFAKNPLAARLVELLDGWHPLTYLCNPFGEEYWEPDITFEVMAELGEEVPRFEDGFLDREVGPLLRALVARRKVSLTYVGPCANTYKVVATDVSVLLAKVPTLALREELFRRG